MNNAPVVSNSLSMARRDLDEATNALSNYLETKSDEESVAWLYSAIEATVRAISSVLLAIEKAEPDTEPATEPTPPPRRGRCERRASKTYMTIDGDIVER